MYNKLYASTDNHNQPIWVAEWDRGVGKDEDLERAFLQTFVVEEFPVFCERQAQRGPLNIALGGTEALVALARQKLDRVKGNLGGQYNEDDCVDGSNYFRMLLMTLRGQWPKPPEVVVEKKPEVPFNQLWDEKQVLEARIRKAMNYVSNGTMTPTLDKETTLAILRGEYDDGKDVQK